jgi:hypothetical protein
VQLGLDVETIIAINFIWAGQTLLACRTCPEETLLESN